MFSVPLFYAGRQGAHMYAICFAFRAFGQGYETRMRIVWQESERIKLSDREGDRLISMNAFQHSNKSKSRFLAY